ncbi:phage fiber-tail adaptor protein [Zavarzinella formosa]|uniref:phage fiber-tail adaptor protein n=1 Tax=Zavarzinella formosa TaxID=360055 RepID=UPI0003151459|nr:hypothetical protein [Zavarzinella formosa]
MSESFIKDPSARLDYQIDWSDWLEDDTIAASAWTVPAGIAQYGSATNTATSATIWLTGGTPGTDYFIVNQITTTEARINQQTLKLLIRER